MRALIANVLLNPFVLLPIGLLIAILGGFSLADIPATLHRVRRVEQLPLLAVAARGQAAYVEGRVSDHNPTVYRQFVAYLREEYRRNWVEVARATPPLVIEADGRLTQVINHDYSFEATAVTVEEEPPAFSRGAIQSRGFVVGSRVLVVGSKADKPEELVAEFLYPGTRAEFVAHQRGYLQRSLWWGSGFLLIGSGCVILGLRQLRKFLRETRAAEQAREARARQHEQNAKRSAAKKKRR